MKPHKLIWVPALIALPFIRADAQQIHEAIASGGGDASGTNGTVSYTIGQVFYTTLPGAGGSVAEGIQTTVNLGNPLPVELRSFEGQCESGKVVLHWKTATEINHDFFAVEKSADASQWTSIATIKRPKDYTYTDEHPATPVSYYRLKQVDLDGTFSYSPVVHVVGCGGTAKAIALYPNPTATGIYVSAPEIDHAEYELYDTKGSLLHQGRLQKGITYIDMAAWAQGTYFIKLKQNNHLLNNFSILKN